MAEGGLSATEVGREIGQHAKHVFDLDRRDRLLSITEAVLLSVVAVLAAWSGFAAAKWNTESRLHLAESTTIRTKASRAHLEALSIRNFDSSTFDAWFSAFTDGNERAMAIAERRFRPEFRRAFLAWRATKPESNPHAPKGPTYMPQYRQPGLVAAEALDRQAEREFAAGEEAGQKSDDYVRVTVFLAVVLFLVGISAHFPLRSARYGLISLALILLAAALVQLALLDRPP
jgi:hypothetical protein